MKQFLQRTWFGLTMSLMLIVMNIAAFAQDAGTQGAEVTKTTTTSTSTSNDWYAAPWVWVVGAIVVILILFALLRGNSNTTTEKSSTTIIKERP